MYTQGMLAIGVFDNVSPEPVWHGWVRRQILNRDIDNREPAIAEAVLTITGCFPAGRVRKRHETLADSTSPIWRRGRFLIGCRMWTMWGETADAGARLIPAGE
jgi:hypothetical protein